jgi:uncharacterized RDD family membrane protein YckC
MLDASSSALPPYEYEPVSGLRRVSYSLIDAALFCFIWVFTINYANVSPPTLAFMSRYTPADYKNYIYAVSIMSLILFINSVVMHWLFGGSAGKLITGCRTYRTDGSKMSIANALMRSLFCFGIALSILAPGPIVAAIFGGGSDYFALGLLSAGFFLWIAAMTSYRARLTFHEKLLGIQTVRVA